nr:PQQ-dependent sugar dehydrogenase [Streptomyces sp. NBC_00830]
MSSAPVRLIRPVLAVAALLGAAAVPARADVPPDPPAALLPATATASSESSAEHTAAAAVDGDSSTSWHSKAVDVRQWISADLGAMSTIDGIRLDWGAACARAYRVQASPDGVYWHDLHSTTSGEGGVEELAVSGFGRYVRLYATEPCRPYDGYVLAGFQVSGTPGASDSAPPGEPSELRATATTASSVSLAWSPAQDDVEITDYDIYQQGQLVKTVNGTTFSTSISKLSPNTSYGFYVNARDAAGNVSQASNTVWASTTSSDTTPPGAPGGLRTARVSANSISLDWQDSTDDQKVTGYTVYSGTRRVATSTTSSATIQGLPQQTSYTFTVVATDGSKNSSPASEPHTATTLTGNDAVGEVSQITGDKDVPWGLGFLPDGSALMTERDSFRVVRVAPDGTKTTAGTVPGVAGTNGEGGLLGLELSPHFATDHWVYLFHTTATDNRLVRIRYVDETLDLDSEQVLLTGIARNKFHNGGRLRFGPDGMLYIATGDAQRAPSAQDLRSLNGKILRIAPDGSVPADNPFPGSYVYSYGHRNVQGLAFDSRGRLWEAELGNSAMDELNLIRPGGNYGWPACEGTNGDCAEPTFVPPVRTWSVAAASPSGLAIVDDTLYMAALRGTTLWRMRIADDTTTEPEAYFTGTYDRLRTVEPTPDGDLWLTTSNGDKDSVADNSDTRVLRVPLQRPGSL